MKRIRLTESQLNRVIMESVKRALNEIGETEKGQYALGALQARKSKESGYNNDVYRFARDKRKKNGNKEDDSHFKHQDNPSNPMYRSFAKGFKDYRDKEGKKDK